MTSKNERIASFIALISTLVLLRKYLRIKGLKSSLNTSLISLLICLFPLIIYEIRS